MPSGQLRRRMRVAVTLLLIVVLSCLSSIEGLRKRKHHHRQHASKMTHVHKPTKVVVKPADPRTASDYFDHIEKSSIDVDKNANVRTRDKKRELKKAIRDDEKSTTETKNKYDIEKAGYEAVKHKRRREEEYARIDQLKFPYLRGLEVLGNLFNVFTLKITDTFVSPNPRWIRKNLGSYYYREYNVPGLFEVLEDKSLKDELATNVISTPLEYAAARTKEYGIYETAGGYQLNTQMEEIRKVLAEGDYLAEKQRHFKIFSASLLEKGNGRCSHLDCRNRQGIGNADTDLEQLSESELEYEGDPNDPYHALGFLNKDLKEAMCDADKRSLPDCVFDPSYLLLDQDIGHWVTKDVFQGRDEKEASATDAEEEHKVRLCEATDMRNAERFVSRYGTHVIVGVDVGGTVRQTFQINDADVDNTPDFQGHEDQILNIINKYKELVGKHEVSRRPKPHKTLQQDVVDTIAADDAAMDQMGSPVRPRRHLLAKRKGERRVPVVSSDKEDSSTNTNNKNNVLREGELLFRGEHFSNSGLDEDADKILSSRLRKLGIVKVTSSFIGGDKFPSNLKNIDRDDISEWIDSVRHNAVPIKYKSVPLTDMLGHHAILEHCATTDFVPTAKTTAKIEAISEIDSALNNKECQDDPKCPLHFENKAPRPDNDLDDEARAEAVKLFEAEKERLVERVVKQKMKAAIKEMKASAGLPERVHKRDMHKTSGGRRFLRRKILLANTVYFMQLKVDAFAKIAEDSSVLDKKAESLFGRMTQKIWDYEKNLVEVDIAGPDGALPVTTQSGIWARIRQLSETTEDLSPAMSILTPVFQYQMNKFLFGEAVRKTCEGEVNAWKRQYPVNPPNSNLLSQREGTRERLYGDRAQKNATGDPFRSYDIDHPRIENVAHIMEKKCTKKWVQKAESIQNNNIGATSAVSHILKKTFFSNLDQNCDTCVGLVANELDPNREFVMSERGVMTSEDAYCSKMKTKLERVRCDNSKYLLMENMLSLSNKRRYNNLMFNRPLGMYINDLMDENDQFVMYQGINAMTGKQYTPFEIGSAVCKRVMGGCENAVFDEDEILNIDSGSNSKESQLRAEESKSEDVLMKEMGKDSSEFDARKASNAGDAMLDSQSQETCNLFAEMKDDYRSLQTKLRLNREKKICYACSKYTMMMKLERGKKPGHKKALEPVDPGGLYPINVIKYQDFKKKVCSPKLFKGGGSQLSDTENKCGGNPFDGVQGMDKNAIFIEERQFESPLMGALNIQSATMAKSIKGQAIASLKSKIQKFTKGSVTCGAHSFPVSLLDKMKATLKCIHKHSGITSMESPLSVSECKSSLNTLDDLLLQKVKSLAVALGQPIPKDLQLPDRLHFYDYAKLLVYDTNGEIRAGINSEALATESVGFASEGICVDAGMCTKSQEEAMNAYWATQGFHVHESHGNLDGNDPPGFRSASPNTKSFGEKK